MKKQTERELQRQSHWQEIVRKQQQSGRSVRAYCREAGIEESAFYWWRRELARRSRQRGDHAPAGSGSPQVKPTRPAARSTRQGKPARPQGKAARPAARRSSRAVAEVGFLPVRLAADRGAEAGHSIEIVLGGDRVLRILPGFDRQTLLDVLGALEIRGC
jgi:transposase-like protein